MKSKNEYRKEIRIGCMGGHRIVLRLIICSFVEKYFKNCNIQIIKCVSVVLLTALDIGLKEGVTNQIRPKYM